MNYKSINKSISGQINKLLHSDIESIIFGWIDFDSGDISKPLMNLIFIAQINNDLRRNCNE